VLALWGKEYAVFNAAENAVNNSPMHKALYESGNTMPNASERGTARPVWPVTAFANTDFPDRSSAKILIEHAGHQ